MLQAFVVQRSGLAVAWGECQTASRLAAACGGWQKASDRHQPLRRRYAGRAAMGRARLLAERVESHVACPGHGRWCTISGCQPTNPDGAALRRPSRWIGASLERTGGRVPITGSVSSRRLGCPLSCHRAVGWRPSSWIVRVLPSPVGARRSPQRAGRRRGPSPPDAARRRTEAGGDAPKQPKRGDK
jgi:hypothetical protein